MVRGDDYRADTSTNGVVSSGQTLTGTIETSGDEDWFALGATAGTRYSLSLTGTTLSDPWLRVYDSSGTLLLSDRYNWGSAATLSFTADTTERLYVSAGSSSTSSGISGTGTYQLLATSVSDDYSADTSTTGRVTVGESVTGNISFENDNDWFQVSLVAGTRYVMSLNGSITHNGTLADPWLELHDRNGALLTWDDDSGIGSNSEIVYVATQSDTYYLSAEAFSSSQTGTYTLLVTNSPTGDDFSGRHQHHRPGFGRRFDDRVAAVLR